MSDALLWLIVAAALVLTLYTIWSERQDSDDPPNDDDEHYW